MAVDTDDGGEVDPSVPSRGSGDRLLTAFDRFRSSFPLQLVAMGLIFIATGFVLNTGVWAGILPIWGVAFLSIGVGSYAYVTISRRGSQG